MKKAITFGDKLKELRMREKLSLRELASRVGLSAGYISQLENNKQSISGLPSEDNISKIAKVLNADETELALLAGKVSNEVMDAVKEVLFSGKVSKEEMISRIKKMAPEQ